MKIVITKSEIDKSGQQLLNTEQIKHLLSKTPEEHIYTRPAKGGGQWKYVTGVYVKKVLNLMFGWDWDFEVVEYKFDLDIKQAFVLGKLKVRVQGKEIVKMQFGRVDIKFKTEWIDGKKHSTMEPLDIGNDLKAATTDALKKCASELGVASDIYGAVEFKEIALIGDDKESKLEVIKKMLDSNVIADESDRMYIEMVIEKEEEESYDKIIKMYNKRANLMNKNKKQ